MEIVFEDAALDDLAFWQAANNEAVRRKIRQLLENMLETPFAGLGKPELLKHQLAKWWSRRIADEHRLVYGVEGQIIRVYQLRFPY